MTDQVMVFAPAPILTVTIEQQTGGPALHVHPDGQGIRLARGGEPDGAVRTGAAAGALNVTRHGLGTGRAEAVRELLGRVRPEDLS